MFERNFLSLSLSFIALKVHYLFTFFCVFFLLLCAFTPSADLMMKQLIMNHHMRENADVQSIRVLHKLKLI